MPIIFRKHATHIYSADYAENSCDMLKNWAENKSSFEWTEVCKWIASIEDSNESPDVMEQSARNKFKAVLRVILHIQSFEIFFRMGMTEISGSNQKMRSSNNFLGILFPQW